MLEYFYKNSAHISQTKQITPLKIFPLSHFNPRSREGSDLDLLFYDILFVQDFNPRSREGSDAVGDMLHVNLGKFQSTLPRGERRLSNFSFIILICISIHAPARGATAEFVDLMTDMEGISIHAPARGATILFSITPTPLKNFNPRSREGSDQMGLFRHCQL